MKHTKKTYRKNKKLNRKTYKTRKINTRKNNKKSKKSKKNTIDFFRPGNIAKGVPIFSKDDNDIMNVNKEFNSQYKTSTGNIIQGMREFLNNNEKNNN